MGRYIGQMAFFAKTVGLLMLSCIMNTLPELTQCMFNLINFFQDPLLCDGKRWTGDSDWLQRLDWVWFLFLNCFIFYGSPFRLFCTRILPKNIIFFENLSFSEILTEILSGEGQDSKSRHIWWFWYHGCVLFCNILF